MMVTSFLGSLLALFFIGQSLASFQENQRPLISDAQRKVSSDATNRESSRAENAACDKVFLGSSPPQSFRQTPLTERQKSEEEEASEQTVSPKEKEKSFDDWGDGDSSSGKRSPIGSSSSVLDDWLDSMDE